MVFFLHIGSAFSELPIPLSDHIVAHNFGSMHVAQLAVDFCWRLLLSMQKSDNCTNLAVGRRQYQCGHFLLALCNNYCSHKTNCPALFPHTPISTAMHAHSHPTTHTSWTRFELTFWMNLVNRQEDPQTDIKNHNFEICNFHCHYTGCKRYRLPKKIS